MSIKRFSQFLFATITLGSMIALPALSAQASAEPSLDQVDQAQETAYQEGDSDGKIASCTPFNCVCPLGYVKECSIDASGRITCYCKQVKAPPNP